MISFSPELGARPQARRGVFACKCDFDMRRKGGGGGGGIVYRIVCILPHFSLPFSVEMSATIMQLLCLAE